MERGAPPPNPRKELVPLLSIKHHWPVRQVIFHHKGEYLATVCPDGDSKGVVIHNFPKKQSQCPFKKTRGQVLVCVGLHSLCPTVIGNCALTDYVTILASFFWIRVCACMYV